MVYTRAQLSLEKFPSKEHAEEEVEEPSSDSASSVDTRQMTSSPNTNASELSVTGIGSLDKASQNHLKYETAKRVIAEKLLPITSLTAVNEELNTCRTEGWIDIQQHTELLTRAAKYGKLETIKWLRGDPCPIRTDWEQ